jgi:hypothetical protein
MGKYKVQVVNCYSLNIRSGAGTSYKVIAWAQKGQTFTSSKKSGSWYYIDEKKGYASDSYIKTIQNLDPPKTPAKNAPKTIGTITTKATVNAYDKIDGKKVNSYKAQTFKYTVAKAPWYQVVTSQGLQWIKITTAAHATTGTTTLSKADYDKINAMINSGKGKTTTDRMGNVQGDKRKSSLAPAPATAVDKTALEAVIESFGGDEVQYDDKTGEILKGGAPTVVNWTLSYSEFEKNFDILRKNLNIIGETKNNIGKDLFTRFNRFHLPYVDHHLSKTFSHVFFTRPSCNFMTGDTALHTQFEKDPLIYYLWNNNSDVIKGLTTHLSSSHDFHPYLSNSAQSFDVPDEIIKTTEHGETFTGYKLLYGRHNIESNTAGQFTVQFKDDKHFTIYKTHKAWIEYISRVYRGTARPTLENMANKILDYACAVYYFICAEDGETLLFWSKYFGVFPLNAPASAATWAKGSGGANNMDFGINYAYAMKEDFSPLTLSEFNKNSSDAFKYRKIYDSEVGGAGRSLVGAPFIESSEDTTKHSIYKLKFRS